MHACRKDTFKGVGGKCGFDLATSALCQMR